jgi:hypothetical protein
MSTKRQADFNTSLERQAKTALAICAQYGWELTDLPPDAVSGNKMVAGENGELVSKNKAKGALGIFLRQIREGTIPLGSVLIVDDMSRFSRNENPLDVLGDLNFILKSGMGFYSCADGQYYTMEKLNDNPYCIQTAGGAIIAAGQYSKELKRKIGAAFTIKRQMMDKGLKVATGSWAPWWITFYPDNPKQINSVGKYDFNEKRAIADLMVREYLQGRGGYAIAQKLNDGGYSCPKSGKYWSHCTVLHTLTLKSLYGTAVLRGVEYPDYFPALIDKPTYERIQQQMKLNTAKHGAISDKDNVNTLFPNKIKCAHCGETVFTWTSSKKHRGKGWCPTSYRCCMHKRHPKKCPVKDSIPAREVEMDFFMNVLMAYPKGVASKKDSKLSEHVAQCQADIAKYDTAIEKVVATMDVIEIPELAKKLNDLEKSRNDARNRLAGYQELLIGDSTAPRITDEIRKIVFRVDNAEYGSKRYYEALGEYDTASNILIDQLQDQETRKRLVPMLAQLIKQITMDLELMRYQVQWADGRKTDWQDLSMNTRSKDVYMLRSEHEKDEALANTAVVDMAP